MKNEYGVTLDRNGYAPSIIPGHDDRRCLICGKNGESDPLNRHEVFGGTNRQKSKRLGLWGDLCHDSCRQGLNGVHHNREMDLLIKEQAQQCAMRKYGWSIADFILEFGKNYL